MNGKLLRKSAAQDVKKYFWIFFVAVLAVNAVSLFFSDIVGSFKSLMGLLTAARNGMLTAEQFGDTTSPLYMMLVAESSILSGIIAMFSLPAMIFLINPLEVGISKLFLEGIKEEPKLKTLTEPFKKSYLNTVATMVLSTLFLMFITFALAFLYIAVVMLITVPAIILTEYNLSVTAILIIAGILIAVATVGYLALTIFISYNFAFIPYIIAEHDNCKFVQAYETNKRMVYKRKREMFKTEFIYYFWEFIAGFVTTALISAGIVLAIMGSGEEMLAIGILLIVPMLLIILFVNVYRNALWARMYRVLEIPLYQIPVYQNMNVNNNGSYTPPVYQNIVDYGNKEEKNDINDNEEETSVDE